MSMSAVIQIRLLKSLKVLIYTFDSVQMVKGPPDSLGHTPDLTLVHDVTIYDLEIGDLSFRILTQCRSHVLFQIRL